MLLLFPSTLVAESLWVYKILDGDTIDFIGDNGILTRCRVLGIDTPEKYKGRKLSIDALRTGIAKDTHLSAGHLSSNYAMEYFSYSRAYKVTLMGKDLYGRDLCVIENYNCDILKDGYAVVYKNGVLTKDKEYRNHLNLCQLQGIDRGLNIEYRELMNKLRGE